MQLAHQWQNQKCWSWLSFPAEVGLTWTSSTGISWMRLNYSIYNQKEPPAMTKLLFKTPLSVPMLVAPHFPFLFVWHLHVYLERGHISLHRFLPGGKQMPVNQWECGQIEIYLDRCLSVFQVSLDSSYYTNLTFSKLWVKRSFLGLFSFLHKFQEAWTFFFKGKTEYKHWSSPSMQNLW